MPANRREQIRAKIRQLAANPADLANNITALRGGDGQQRLRIGDYRVIFEIDGGTLMVLAMGPRGGVY